jgi:hypothetical protein
VAGESEEAELVASCLTRIFSVEVAVVFSAGVTGRFGEPALDAIVDFDRGERESGCVIVFKNG